MKFITMQLTFNYLNQDMLKKEICANPGSAVFIGCASKHVHCPRMATTMNHSFTSSHVIHRILYILYAPCKCSYDSDGKMTSSSRGNLGCQTGDVNRSTDISALRFSACSTAMSISAFWRLSVRMFAFGEQIKWCYPHWTFSVLYLVPHMSCSVRILRKARNRLFRLHW